MRAGNHRKADDQSSRWSPNRVDSDAFLLLMVTRWASFTGPDFRHRSPIVTNTLRPRLAGKLVSTAPQRHSGLHGRTALPQAMCPPSPPRKNLWANLRKVKCDLDESHGNLQTDKTPSLTSSDDRPRLTSALCLAISKALFGPRQFEWQT